MGVKGLTRFVDAWSADLLVEEQLCDCAVVIDGLNLAHWLYNSLYCLPNEGNGDYFDYVLAIRTFFSALATCSIRPLVIVDASDADPRTAETQLQRAEDRVRVGCECKGGYLSPICIDMIFTSELTRLKIPFYVTPTADRIMASEARLRDCFLLTNDSDSFLSNIPCGVILLDYLDLNPILDCDSGVERYYLPAEQITRKRLADLIAKTIFADKKAGPLIEPVLPLIAAIMDTKQLVTILYNQDGAKKSGGDTISVVARFISFAAVQASGNWDTVVKLLLGKISSTSVKQEFENNAEHAHMFYHETMAPIYENAAKVFDKFSKGGKELTQPAKELLAKDKLSRALCGSALVHRRVLLWAQFEPAQLPSSWDFSADVRRLLYSKLLRVAEKVPIEGVILEWNRVGYLYKEENVQTKFALLGPISAVSWLSEIVSILLARQASIQKVGYNDNICSISLQLAQSCGLPRLFIPVTVAWLVRLASKFRLQPKIIGILLTSMCFSAAAVIRNYFSPKKQTSPGIFDDVIKKLQLPATLLEVFNRPIVAYVFSPWIPLALAADDFAALSKLGSTDGEDEVTVKVLFHGSLLTTLFYWLYREIGNAEIIIQPDSVVEKLRYVVEDLDDEILTKFQAIYSAALELLVTELEFVKPPKATLVFAIESRATTSSSGKSRSRKKSKKN